MSATATSSGVGSTPSSASSRVRAWPNWGAADCASAPATNSSGTAIDAMVFMAMLLPHAAALQQGPATRRDLTRGLAKRRNAPTGISRPQSVPAPSARSDAGTPQQSTVAFFVPLAVAYLLPCAIWLLLQRLRPGFWPAPPAPTTDRPRLDLALGCFAVA